MLRSSRNVKKNKYSGWWQVQETLYHCHKKMKHTSISCQAISLIHCLFRQIGTSRTAQLSTCTKSYARQNIQDMQNLSWSRKQSRTGWWPSIRASTLCRTTSYFLFTSALRLSTTSGVNPAPATVGIGLNHLHLIIM